MNAFATCKDTNYVAIIKIFPPFFTAFYSSLNPFFAKVFHMLIIDGKLTHPLLSSSLFLQKVFLLNYELSDIEWRLQPRQLKMEFAKFLDGRILGNPVLNENFKKYKNLDLAIKVTTYRSITADYKDFLIKELHRIKTAINNHKIEDEDAFFKRYINTNYRGLLKLYNEAQAAKPPRASFRSAGFKNSYKRRTTARINYLLQKELIIPLKTFIESDFADDLVLNNTNSTQDRISFSNTDSTRQKLIWRGNINKLVTIFYELANSELYQGKPVLQATTHELIDLIYNNFLDKDGNDLSRDTIATILRPGRADKRSPEHKKYNFPSEK